jgi:hypothetical protein
MQRSIALEVLAAVAKDGFSLDELVYRTSDLFHRKGLPGFVSLVLQLVEDGLVMGLMMHGGEGWWPTACCDEPDYELLDRLDRKLRTSLGVIELRWRRLRCSRCGKTLIPLREFLGLERYQSKTSELEKVVAEVVSEQSYRRTSSHLGSIGLIPVPKSTAHRWVMQSDCDELPQSTETFQTLFADGTGYKRRPTPTRDNQGQVRIALGIRGDGDVVPLGAWTESSWQQVADQLAQGLPPGQRRADLLVSDGEPGLPQNIGPLAGKEQRCHWHMVHDLDLRMRQQGAGKPYRRTMQKELAGLLRIELPKQDHQPPNEQDRQQLQQEVQQAQADVDNLVQRLFQKGYHEAGHYVAAARDRLFSYVRVWMELGVINPRAASFIERMMREIGRRLKRMAFGWSPQGAAKMTRIILKRFTSAAQWDDYWKQRLGITGKVLLALQNIRVLQNPQPLGR